MSGIQRQWLEAHKDYPHKDWCLVWPFARDSFTGRPSSSARNGGSKWAHRIMCEMAHGSAPEGKPQVGHNCGNGHEGCVNPLHLSWVSNSENQRLRYAQGRGNPSANGSKSRYTPEQIAEMRSLYIDGDMTQWQIAERFGCSLGLVQYFIKYRNTRGHAGLKVNHWSPDEDIALRVGLAGGTPVRKIAESLGRSWGSTYSHAKRIGLIVPNGRPLLEAAE